MITTYTNTTPEEEAIYAMLIGYQPLVDAVEGNISPDVEMDQSAKRYVVYHIITGTPTSVKKQISRVDNVRFQVDTYAKTRHQASADAKLARAAIENRTGTFAGLKVTQSKWESFNGNFDEGNEQYKTSNDFIIKIQNE